MLKIEAHPNYGQDLHRVQSEMSIPLKPKLRLLVATLQILNGIRREIGLRNLFSMLSKVKRRTHEALEEYDFSSVRTRGISDEDIKVILERMITGEEMAREMGPEKARELDVGDVVDVGNRSHADEISMPGLWHNVSNASFEALLRRDGTT